MIDFLNYQIIENGPRIIHIIMIISLYSISQIKQKENGDGYEENKNQG